MLVVLTCAAAFLPLALQAVAAPTDPDLAWLNRVVPEAPRVPRCDVTDVDCECSANLDGTTEYACGYVDPEWRFTSARRSTEPRPVGHAIEAPPVARPYEGSHDELVVVRQEMDVLRVDDPLKAALGQLGFGMPGRAAQRVVLNRTPAGFDRQWVTGLVGALINDTTIDGTLFPARASWMVRWDYSAYGPNATMPPTNIIGPYVKLLVEGRADQSIRRAWAYYYDEDSPSYAERIMGDYYLANVIKRLTLAASYTSRAFRRGEDAAVDAIVGLWSRALNGTEPCQRSDWPC